MPFFAIHGESKMQTQPRAVAPYFPPLETVTRDFIPTDHAAYYVGRKPQTLRGWACGAVKSPIRPRRINGRLAWPVADIRELLGVTADA